MAASEPPPIVVDASALTPDAATLDALARLALVACRLGRRIEVRGASARLRELIAFAGLADALGVEPRRQAEQREQLVGLEEEGELGQPPA